MIPPKISIGPLSIHLYGVIMALAIYAGYQFARKRANFYKIPFKYFDDPILLIPLFLGFAFARAYHVIDNIFYYWVNPYQIFNLAGGGLGIMGGILGIFLGFSIVARIKKLETLKVFDLVSPSLLLGQAIGRVGNWINQEGFGPPTNLPSAVYINPQNRPLQYQLSDYFHPTFFYEAILDLIFFLILLKLSTRFKKPGQTFALYLMLYAVGRLVAEFFRIDTFVISGIKVAYVISTLLIIFGFFLFFQKAKFKG
ncbi:prolipoprotein diacylglyceryl transferase [Candidatus Curtissbacteria bacterium]|nr:prolipoprotein diacylglyceryl transferase [Candidatus Curtissbacteria bacterium]